MNPLLEKYNDYMRLKGCSIEYTLADASLITYTYDEKAFLHLLGIHKLVDLQLIQFWQDKSVKSVKLDTVIKKIKQEKFTDTEVRSSTHFGKIQDRYDSFNYNNLTTLNYTDAIVDFDPSIIGSKLKSKHILFEQKRNGNYNHMGIALDPSGYRYIESFFNEPTNKYITGQTIIPVSTFKIIDSSGNIIVQDSF